MDDFLFSSYLPALLWQKAERTDSFVALLLSVTMETTYCHVGFVRDPQAGNDYRHHREVWKVDRFRLLNGSSRFRGGQVNWLYWKLNVFGIGLKLWMFEQAGEQLQMVVVRFSQHEPEEQWGDSCRESWGNAVNSWGEQRRGKNRKGVRNSGVSSVRRRMMPHCLAV